MQPIKRPAEAPADQAQPFKRKDGARQKFGGFLRKSSRRRAREGGRHA